MLRLGSKLLQKGIEPYWLLLLFLLQLLQKGIEPYRKRGSNPKKGMEPFWLLLLFLLQRTLPQKGIEPYCYYSYCSYCKRGSNPTAEGDRTLSAIATIPIAAIAKGDRTLPQKGIEPYWLLLLFLLQLSKGDRTLLLLLLLQLLQKGIEPYLLLLLFLLQVLQKRIEPYCKRESNPIAKGVRFLFEVGFDARWQ